MSIRKVERFITDDGVEHDTLEEAGTHQRELLLLRWLEARMPVSEVAPFAQQLTEDFVITPRKGWIA